MNARTGAGVNARRHPAPRVRAARAVHRLVVILIACVSLVPFCVLLGVSFTSAGGAGSAAGAAAGGRPGLLAFLHLENYVKAASLSHIGAAIANSLLITGGSLLIIVTLAGAAGYAIARFGGKLNAFIYWTFLVFLMIPGIINTVPLYSLMRAVHGINTRWAMILLLAANALPFSVFLYAGFIKSLSREVEESAVVDGCSWFSAFWRVTFHFIKPVTAAVVIINGIGIWNNYAQSVFFLQRQEVRTIPLAVSLFFQQYGAQWNLMAAAAVLGAAPAVLAFLVFQKQFIKGIATGAVKG
jgi:raffinose/stachyose/melibiose transport system permease protein